MVSRFARALAPMLAFVAPTAYLACRERPLDPPPTSAASSAAGAAAATPDRAHGDRHAANERNRDAGALDAVAGSSLQAQVAVLRQACSEPRSVLAGPPSGGTVFNNAMTSEDAGHIDRMARVLDALQARGQAFRCCFDAWTSEGADTDGQLMLVLELAADGTVEGAHVDPRRTTILHPLAQRCVIDVAREAEYPPSPMGRPTLVEYPFHVSSR